MTFSQYWQSIKLDPELTKLNQKQVEALRKMMRKAYTAGMKAGKATT